MRLTHLFLRLEDSIDKLLVRQFTTEISLAYAIGDAELDIIKLLVAYFRPDMQGRVNLVRHEDMDEIRTGGQTVALRICQLCLFLISLALLQFS